MSTEETIESVLADRAVRRLADAHDVNATGLASLIREIRNNPNPTTPQKNALRGIKEHVPFVVTGEYRDIRIYPDGRVVDSGFNPEDQNIVVNSFAILLAALCLTARAGWNGITHMAVGTGSPTWDTPGGRPLPLATDTQLTAELTRKPLDSISDINSQNSVVTTGPTGKLLFSCSFLPGEALGQLREFGLFGGIPSPYIGQTYTSMLQANSGVMVDHVIHGVVTKDISDDFTMVRQVRLSF